MTSPPLQSGLFAGASVLVDDARGRIDHRPGFLPPAEAAAAFDTLLRGVPWHDERRRMYDREVMTPRLLASFALDGPLPGAIASIAGAVATEVGAAFTHVGLNLYRDENDSVAPHNDHLDELEAGAPIALVSLGATRDMIIRAKQPPRRSLRIALEAGSLLVMSYATQLHYDHGIPKQRVPVGPRISLAFRVRAASSRRY